MRCRRCPGENKDERKRANVSAQKNHGKGVRVAVTCIGGEITVLQFRGWKLFLFVDEVRSA